MEVRTRISQKTYKSFCIRTGHSPTQGPRPSTCAMDPGHNRIEGPSPTSRTSLCGPGVGEDTRGTLGGTAGSTGARHTPHFNRDASSPPEQLRQVEAAQA